MIFGSRNTGPIHYRVQDQRTADRVPSTRPKTFGFHFEQECADALPEPAHQILIGLAVEAD